MQLGLVLQQIPRILVGVQIVVLTEPALWVKVIGTNPADTTPVCGRQKIRSQGTDLPAGYRRISREDASNRLARADALSQRHI